MLLEESEKRNKKDDSENTIFVPLTIPIVFSLISVRVDAIDTRRLLSE